MNRLDRTDGGTESMVGGTGGRLLFTVSVGWMAIQTGRLVLSPMLPAVMADLGISDVEAGFAFTVMWVVYSAMQFPSGRLSDQLSRVTLLVAGLGLAAVGFMLLSIASTYPLYLAGAAIAGLGAGLYPTAASALVSDLFVARRGRAFGVFTGFGDAGGALAAGLAVLVLAIATWHRAFVPVSVVLLLTLVVLHRWRRRPYELHVVEFELQPTARRLFGSRRVIALLFAYVLYAFTWQGAVAFLPTFLQRTKGFSPALAGGGFAALFVVGAVVKPISGGLGDGLSKPFVGAAGLALAAFALAVALWVESHALVALGIVGFAVGLMAFSPVMQAYLMDVFPTESMGGDLGAARSLYIGLGSLGPTYVGFVAGTWGYGLAFAGLLICLLVSAGLVVTISL